MLDNFRNRFLEDNVNTGVLEGQAKLFFKPFGHVAAGNEILTNEIIGVLLEQLAFDVTGGPPELIENPGQRALAPLQRAKLDAYFRRSMKLAKDNDRKYKARPLTGVWATAPYLHNGSVPTLEDLLKPDKCPAGSAPAICRPSTFYVGSTQFDFKKVGFSIEPTDAAVLFDTTLPGNSNRGHSGPEYGTDLDDDKKAALLEYLKVIGESTHH